MGREIERKFLVDEVPAVARDWPADEIAQGYLAADERSEVRIRRRGGRSTLTVKTGRGRVRGEYEVELNPAQDRELWPATGGQRIEKRRSVGEVDGWTVELDVYTGDLEGLVVVEVEFPDEEAAEAFSAPAWFASEVTGDDRYSNRRLATEGAPASR